MNPRFARVRAGQTPSSDPELMRGLARGELGALGELYDRYHAAVHAFLARATCDAHDVDDLVHVAFLTAADSAERYDGRDCCRPWLIGIAARLLRRRRRTLGLWIALLATVRGAHGSATDPRAMLQARSQVSRALARLSERKRVALLMAEVEGMSCEEIAEGLQVPIGTVWTRLHAARRELRHALQKDEQP
jgi:RNA polymerase sigma-70 factor (ECF subfamily)